MSALGPVLRSRACKPERERERERCAGRPRQPINSAGRYPHWDDVEAELPCAAVFAHVFGSETQVQGHSVGP
ncbi:hypothetical protein LY76DRAFT_518841 [Colletotrichum caudatum]|nr:hypothetical protein LY76DRAFT_518841 [Colletotrichum caudatum]